MRKSPFHGLYFLAILAGTVALSSATGAVAGHVRIEVNDLAFDPADAVAQVGDTIDWVNRDFIDHTATERGGAWDLALPAGGTTHMIIRSAGTVEYYCRFHPDMKGTLRVRVR